MPNAQGHPQRPSARSTPCCPRSKQGTCNGNAGKARQVVLIELHEGLVGSPIQGVIEVVAGGRGEPDRHARVRRVSRDVHVDLAASMSEIRVQVTTVRGSPRVAEMIKHILKQGRKAGTVQPVVTEPSVGPEGGVGVVVHLSTTRKKRIIISSIEQRQQTRTQKKPPRQHVNSDSDSDQRRSRKTWLHENGAESGNLLNTKMIDNFDTFPKGTNTPSYAQQFRSYDHCKLGRGIRSG
jgi:hypothetical protein